MSLNNALAAEILESSAGGFASAANRLLEQHAASEATLETGRSSWKPHFEQRILELAAAVRLEDPALFRDRVEWLRRACQARGTDEGPLRISIESLRDALREELPQDMSAVVSATVDQAVRSFDAPLAPGNDRLDGTTAEGRLSLEYLRACLEGRTVDAIGLIKDAAAKGKPVGRLLLDVLVPAQKETGQLWHAGDISVAEERLVSETTRQLLTILADRYSIEQRTGRTMLAASVSGNAHDMAIRVIAALFQLDGWRCLLLGADVPRDEIADAARDFQVPLVLLNATLSTQLKELENTIARIRSVAPEAKILIGGLALQSSPDLWKKFDADAFALDAESALQVGESLLAG
jgi:methanogenic corrinoid protein MtbC1